MFDLEISFLYPWAVSLSTLSIAGYTAMVVFLILLTLGDIDYQNRKIESSNLSKYFQDIIDKLK